MNRPSLRFTIVRGVKEHHRHADLLLRLRESTGRNRNASTDPIWFASSSVAASRRPWTVLMWQGDDLAGAVLLREQIAYGLPIGYFYAGNAAADDFIIARAEHEADVLVRCLGALIERLPSAVILLAMAADCKHLPWRHLAGSASVPVRYRLALKASWDKTLEQFGTRSRRNLRYYSRRLLADGAAFHPGLTESDVREAVFSLQTRADFPKSRDHLGETLSAHGRTPGNFAVGLRKADGRWLSVLLGWREGRTTYVFFQMNDITEPQSSISTALRSLFLQDEQARGTSEIRFVASTSSLMENGCIEDRQFILLLAKQTVRKRLITLVADTFLPKDHRLKMALTQPAP